MIPIKTILLFIFTITISMQLAHAKKPQVLDSMDLYIKNNIQNYRSHTKELAKRRFIDFNATPQIENAFFALHKAFQGALLKELKKGSIKKAVIIAHIKDFNTYQNCDYILSKTMENEKNVHTFCQQNFTPIVMYLPTRNVTLVLSDSKENLNSNVVVKHIKNIDSDHSGITYFLVTKQGTLLMFSISIQESNDHTIYSNNGGIWFGNVKSPIVAKRIVKLESFFKLNDIDIYKMLGMSFNIL